MSSGAEIGRQLTAVLHKAARTLNLKKYSFDLNIDAHKGDGFMGDFYKVSVLDEESNSRIALALKKAPTNPQKREEYSVEKVYRNEIHFYSTIQPALKKFEEEQGVPKPFNSIAEYVTSFDKIGEEIIVLKDITSLGFELREKKLLLDESHSRLVFETYGHFHAISFCLKERNPQLFEELMGPVYDMLKDFEEQSTFFTMLNQITEKCFNALDPEKYSDVREKFRKYVDNTVMMYRESMDYRGSHFGILHGDCWSNNMMFKYQKGNHSKPEDIVLLDWQVPRVGTPVYDLSYFFYTGCSKEMFDRLEEYLDVYHASFSKWARELGCDPTKLLPRDILSQDWKKYSKFGVMTSLILSKVKLISKEDSLEMAESFVDSEGNDKFADLDCNEEVYTQRVRDILVHSCEIGAL